jgi:hypothetical protein
LDQVIADGTAVETRRMQLLSYFWEFFVRPTYGSPVSAVYCGRSSDGSLGDLSLDDDDGLGFSDENEE